MKELKIGEEIRIRCVEDISDNDCVNCYLHGICNFDHPYCSWNTRDDSMNVHFEIVEE